MLELKGFSSDLVYSGLSHCTDGEMEAHKEEETFLRSLFGAGGRARPEPNAVLLPFST